MTLLLVRADDGASQRLVEIENKADGVEAVADRVGTWQEAMADPAFVRSMDSFLEAAEASDADVYELPADEGLKR